MKSNTDPYVVENIDDIIDPEFFSDEDRKRIIHSAWVSFLEMKKERELPPLSEDELRKRYYSMDDSPIGSQKRRSKKQVEYDARYTGALIRLFKAYDKADAALSHSEV